MNNSRQKTFIYYKFNTKGDLSFFERNHNVFIFVLKGTLDLSIDKSGFIKIKAKHMITIPNKTSYKLSYPKNSSFILFYYTDPYLNATKNILVTMQTNVNENSITPYILHINKVLLQYLKLLIAYENHTNLNTTLHNMNKEKLFSIIKSMYSSHDVEHFFYHVLKQACSFRQYILDNHEQIERVYDLIKGSNMCSSSFHVKFQETFGVSAKQWLIVRKKENILERMKDINVTAKNIMIEFRFSSPGHLNTFCKKQFGKTPTQLINDIHIKQ